MLFFQCTHLWVLRQKFITSGWGLTADGIEPNRKLLLLGDTDDLVWIDPAVCAYEWTQKYFEFETDDFFITSIDRNIMICAAKNASVSTAKKYDVCFGDDGGKTEIQSRNIFQTCSYEFFFGDLGPLTWISNLNDNETDLVTLVGVTSFYNMGVQCNFRTGNVEEYGKHITMNI